MLLVLLFCIRKKFFLRALPVYPIFRTKSQKGRTTNWSSEKSNKKDRGTHKCYILRLRAINKQLWPKDCFRKNRYESNGYYRVRHYFPDAKLLLPCSALQKTQILQQILETHLISGKKRYGQECRFNFHGKMLPHTTAIKRNMNRLVSQKLLSNDRQGIFIQKGL